MLLHVLLHTQQQGGLFILDQGVRSSMLTFIVGQWHDLVMTNISTELLIFNHTKQKRVYASNWTPLWAGLVEAESEQALKATNSFAKSGIAPAKLLSVKHLFTPPHCFSIISMVISSSIWLLPYVSDRPCSSGGCADVPIQDKSAVGCTQCMGTSPVSRCRRLV